MSSIPRSLLVMRSRYHYGKLSKWYGFCPTAVESGFSVNKELLVKNMKEDTIVAQRIVFDAIRVVGMDVTEMDISKKMVGCVKQSHSAYQSAKQ